MNQPTSHRQQAAVTLDYAPRPFLFNAVFSSFPGGGAVDFAQGRISAYFVCRQLVLSSAQCGLAA